MHNRTIKNEERRKNEKKKNDSRVKTRKGGLEQKRENFWSLMGEENRKMKGQWPNSIWSLYEVLYLLQNQKFELLIPECPPPEFSSLSRWVLMLVKLPYSGTTKINLFKMLDFQRIHFSKKGLGNAPSLCLNYGNKSFEPDYQISSKCRIRRFFNNDHQ